MIHQKVYKKVNLYILLIFLVIVLLQNVEAFPSYPHTPQTELVDKLFESWDKVDSPGAALGIIKDGRIIYARGYGSANLEYDIPIVPQSVFRIGSVSKQFTAMCITILIEQGKVSLDDNIRKYIPEIPDYGSPITVGQLIYHTSGIRCYENLMFNIAGEDEGIFFKDPYVEEYIARQKALNFAPGTEYSYSNSGYFLLAEIVRHASGMKTAEFAKKYIFDTLGMNNTHFHDDRNRIVRNRVTGYSPLKDGGYRINITQLEQIGNGSIFTTIEDFFKWDQNFYNNKLGKGSKELIDLVTTPGQYINSNENVKDGDATYAFGLGIGTYRGLRTIGHGGSYVGFRAFYQRFPDQRFSVIIFSNLSAFQPGEIAYKIADIYLADLMTGPPPPTGRREQEDTAAKLMTLSTSQLKKYCGSFYSDELDAVCSFDIIDNKLMLHLGIHQAELTPVSSNTFTWDGMKMVFSKKRDKFNLFAGRVKNIAFKKMKGKK